MAFKMAKIATFLTFYRILFQELAFCIMISCKITLQKRQNANKSFELCKKFCLSIYKKANAFFVAFGNIFSRMANVCTHAESKD